MTNEEAMALALVEAKRALDHQDVPVGAVVIRDGEVIASRHNERELTSDPVAHAEVLALRDAAAEVATGGWRIAHWSSPSNPARCVRALWSTPA